MRKFNVIGETICVNSSFLIEKGFIYYRIYHIKSNPRGGGARELVLKTKSYVLAKGILDELNKFKDDFIREMKRRTGPPSSQNR